MTNPQQLRPSVVIFSAPDAARVRRLVARLGANKALLALGVGEATLEAARDQGRMLAKTRDRVLVALAKAEGVTTLLDEIAVCGAYPLPLEEEVQHGATAAWNTVRKSIYARDGGVCHVCGDDVPREYYECGHIVDRCRGGSDRPSNLVCMCNVCNRLKPVHATRDEYVRWATEPAWTFPALHPSAVLRKAGSES